ncbi:hypothetical protein EDC04DRAFT_2867899 [Pisolithus marmoratus]|nr:hypothetical protein EDC04DRAFT_2867899 [Pisolithus marmoratus]
MRDWKAPIYAFYSPVPIIEHISGRCCHVFKCLTKSCKHCVWCFLDTGDRASTSNMWKHVKSCWGENILKAVNEAAGLDIARDVIKNYTINGSITMTFEQKGKGKLTYSHQQHTKAEVCVEIVRWVAENLQPYEIMKDRGFQSLMKTGRPEYYLPHPSTVSHDVKIVFAKTWNRIAKILQAYDGALNFGTDAWMSPNHKAFIAFSVHLVKEGKPLSMVLNIIEVAKVSAMLMLEWIVPQW